MSYCLGAYLKLQDCVRLLVKEGANFMAKNKMNVTALDCLSVNVSKTDQIYLRGLLSKDSNNRENEEIYESEQKDRD